MDVGHDSRVCNQKLLSCVYCGVPLLYEAEI